MESAGRAPAATGASISKTRPNRTAQSGVGEETDECTGNLSRPSLIHCRKPGGGRPRLAWLKGRGIPGRTAVPGGEPSYSQSRFKNCAGQTLRFAARMRAGDDRYITELAQHMVSLADFWRRKNNRAKQDSAIRILRALVETGMEVDVECADAIAHAVMRALDAMETDAAFACVDAVEAKVEAVIALLQANNFRHQEQATLFQMSHYG